MLCIQRSLKYGFAAGFATGLGAACADGIYGLLGALGFAGVIAAWPTLSTVLKIGGGLFLIWLAYSIARESSPAVDVSNAEMRASIAKNFATTFALTLANPMTIFAFIGIFAALGPLSNSNPGTDWLLISLMVSGVFAGSALWWLTLSSAAAVFRQAIPTAMIRGLSRLPL